MFNGLPKNMPYFKEQKYCRLNICILLNGNVICVVRNWVTNIVTGYNK